MKLLPDDEIGQWTQPPILSWLTHIDEASIQTALNEYGLGTSMDITWFVAQVRHAFFCSVGSNLTGYPGVRAVRQELQQLSKSLAEALRLYAGRSEWAESVLRRHVMLKTMRNADWNPFDGMLRKTTPDDWWSSGNELMRAESAEWKRFDDALKALPFLESTFNNAIQELCSTDAPPRWRDIRRREERIAFAIWLSPVFEAAYKKPATINNWVNVDGKINLGPWSDFFSRIGSMALQSSKIPDLSGILKTARKMYLADQKGDFNEGN